MDSADPAPRGPGDTFLVAAVSEVSAEERRAALTPAGVRRLAGAGIGCVVQSGLGIAAGFPDEDYLAADAQLAPDAHAALSRARILVKVGVPTPAEIAQLPEGAVVLSLSSPGPDATAALARAGLTAFALERLPRISRAQAMDALSSQATVAGYWAALLAAERAGRFFPMLMTAAGTVPPARVLVIGAGVAGLQAIATCRRLGAMVEAYDVRPATKQEVESLGARFVELPLEVEEGEGGYARELTDETRTRLQKLLEERVAASDALITTAAVPGRPAPRIVTEAMVASMHPGAVIVDLAAPSGGNCELTRAGEEVVHRGVTILGPRNAPAMMPAPASELYARNVAAFLELIVEEGRVVVDVDDEIVAATCVVRRGEVRSGVAETAP